MLNSQTAFTIYNASAGSGKTYTLVKNYLLKILASPNPGRYKQILAVTFTNKAVAEMKQRILESLYGFSQLEVQEQHKSMFYDVKRKLEISEKQLQVKSKEVLHYLLHNYTAFNVQTIDKFTQSVIRTFAFDLNLSTNFEVEIDSISVLEQSVDELLNKVGKDKSITKIVLDFMKSNINEDATWNIKKSLIDISKILLNEEDIPYLKQLENKTIEDFETLKKQLQKRIQENKEEIISKSKVLLIQFETKGVLNDFSRNTIPNHFKKLVKEGNTTYKSTEKWKNNIEETAFYTSKCNETSKQTIEELRPLIEQIFYDTKNRVIENEYIFRILKNITQMSLLQNVFVISEKLKKENNILLISDFNQLIFETIKNQPTPFIYERLGEKFKDFFVDEFQDTSVLQWQNLIPLADNAVSSLLENSEETGSVTLVGDAKQAIYRWRGGKAEQFIDLYQGGKPFSNPSKSVENLNTNYRSYSNIITFNNLFFQYLSQQFSSSVYEKLYIEGNQQNSNNKIGGYVQFNFINAKNITEKEEQYAEKTAEIISQILENGFNYKDISILVRRNNEGVVLADYLTKLNIPVISFESLLLKNSNSVQLLVSYAYAITNIENRTYKLEFLKALSICFDIENKHQFLYTNIDVSISKLEKVLLKYNIKTLESVFDTLSIYEAFEHGISLFNLEKRGDTYLQFFMDLVFEYAQKKNLGIMDFLDFWELKKEKLSIVIPEEENAVQIMSIHKSKGLEFNVVIYPFADTEIFRNKPLNVWLPINEFSEVFPEAYISYNKSIFETYSDTTQKLQTEIKELQELDNFNVLYVALTRAKEHLYIISNENKLAKSLPEGSFQSYFLDFLSKGMFSIKEENSFCFGIESRVSKEKNSFNKSIKLQNFISSNKLNHGIRIVIPVKNSQRDEAIIKGDLIHEIFSKIKDRLDIDSVLSIYKNNFIENEFIEVRNNIQKVCQSEVFKAIFTKKNTIFNERDFYYANEVLRPDRVEIDANNIVHILDYKTGTKNDDYLIQIEKYAAIFENLGYNFIKKYIVYIGKSVDIEEF